MVLFVGCCVSISVPGLGEQAAGWEEAAGIVTFIWALLAQPVGKFLYIIHPCASKDTKMILFLLERFKLIVKSYMA